MSSHLFFGTSSCRGLSHRWISLALASGVPCIQVLPHKSLWPQQLQRQEKPLPTAFYGHCSPFTVEDKMFLFDQLARWQPLSVNLFYHAHDTSNIDLFFCTFLANYVQVPCFLFEQLSGPPVAQDEVLPLAPVKYAPESENIYYYQVLWEGKKSVEQTHLQSWLRKI